MEGVEQNGKGERRKKKETSRGKQDMKDVGEQEAREQ